MYVLLIRSSGYNMHNPYPQKEISSKLDAFGYVSSVCLTLNSGTVMN